MAKTDYYELLGAQRGASADELKKSYRKLAMQYHPDRNPGDKSAEQKFKDINEAYDVLKDEQKRAAYDRFGHAAFENGGAGAGGFGGGGFGFEGGIGDIFEQMFGEAMGGRRGGGRSERAGADIRAGVEIDLTQAFAGTKVDVRVPTRVTCDACSGTGSADKQASADNCPTCGGAGRVRAQQGFFVVERTCPTCGGAGRTIRNPCRICAGAGTVPRERNLSVAIPAGVEDGTRIRLSGEGEAGGKGAPAGDLYVHVAIRAHPIFQRDGANVFCRVPLRMGQASLGGEIEVPAIDGTRARVKIPAGTQTGDQFRLRGKGFSVLRSTQRGDMYIQVAVETPQNLTKRQRELLEEFERESGGSASGSPEHEGFFAKVKEFFEGL
ncbi:MAG: molecular chaperone DnaJ [Acidiphilium sp. 37-64-53]|uniref:Chaperone protein DnaJ n=2 Tax=Acidocellaceae TaxID=3385905 RepID=A0A8G2CM52_ACIRU|nr:MULTISPECIES: molecular chaperone DnaJ [Acidiphilium]MBW4035748.1 molecular chaperone DnaJ [Pseudomonadota bacterium]OYW02082.1 MAG: molecular chaperone DnaJ [Acidiphilium sp. 37-64-53]OZB30581.1 MAG: molecular chaperone DnaJ [Acidiphilium sp. 34-64-41]SIR16540.1 molecular chaperone DnaJ [Acidiphilium rubrum]HQT84656.1 molecular chaperone DnaJ [Acidiphilium rubrum]